MYSAASKGEYTWEHEPVAVVSRDDGLALGATREGSFCKNRKMQTTQTDALYMPLNKF